VAYDDLPPSLRSWVSSLGSTGLFDETTPGRLRLRASQTELAAALGYSPGSGALSRRLQRLESSGVLVSRRPLTIEVPARGSSEPTIDPFLTAVLDRAIENRLESLALRVFEEVLASRRDLRVDAPAAARLPRESARYAPGWGSSFPIVPTSTASSGALSARNARPADGSYRNAAQLRSLLAPLLAACAERGLPGITNMPGLLTALQDVCDEDVLTLSSHVIEQMHLGAPLRSPVGLLASLAAPGASPDSF